MKEFEDYLCERNDEIDNAAFDLLSVLANDPQYKWDMSQIGELVMCAEVILDRAKVDICHPYYFGDDEPCIHDNEGCENINCPFRKEMCNEK